MQWRLKSPASRLFAQPFVCAQTKEDIKAPRHWPLWGESTGHRLIRLKKGHERGLLMPSSWYLSNFRCYRCAFIFVQYFSNCKLAATERHHSPKQYLLGSRHTIVVKEAGQWVHVCRKATGGSSHEGSDHHPRQYGGGRGRRFGKFTANSHRVCSLVRRSFCELIVNVMATLTRNPELQWFGISPQFQFKVSRGDEGVGQVCFPGDEGVGRSWRGYHCVQMNVGPA